MSRKATRGVLSALVLITIALCSSGVSSASTWDSQAWIATDGDVNAADMFFSFTSLLGPPMWNQESLWIYDFGNTSAELQILNNDITARRVYVYEGEDENWYVSFSPTGTDLSLGTTPLFGFVFKNSDGEVDYSFEAVGGGISQSNQYFLKTTLPDSSFPTSVVQVTDVRPVPLPGSAVLLGSGVLCLLGMGVRHRVF